MSISLKVGVPVPSEVPTSGGAYEFQETIFAEILKRLYQTDSTSDIQFIPVVSDPSQAERWGVDRIRSLSITPSLLTKVRSRAHARLHGLISSRNHDRYQSLTSRWISQTLQQHLDFIWYLNPSILSDQLPFAVTVWDIQHRLQPFFPEVSAFGQWEGREEHYANRVRKAACCVVGTSRGKSELQRFYGIDDERILINPFPCPPSLPASETGDLNLFSSHALADSPYLLYPAQFWSHKNHLGALLALRELLDRGLVLKLVLTGSDQGALQALKAQIKKLELTDSVIHLGFVDRLALAKLYVSAKALLYPSFFGPDNIPPLEAMSYATPAIVADVPGAREQYGDAAAYFMPADPVSMANAVQMVLTDEAKREDLIRKGLALISHLSPAAYVDSMEAYLRRYLLHFKVASAVLRGSEVEDG